MVREMAPWHAQPFYSVDLSHGLSRMKLATWNVNSLAVRLPQVLDWLAANPVDVLALQELKLTDYKFPHAALAEAGLEPVDWSLPD